MNVVIARYKTIGSLHISERRVWTNVLLYYEESVKRRLYARQCAPALFDPMEILPLPR